MAITQPMIYICPLSQKLYGGGALEAFSASQCKLVSTYMALSQSVKPYDWTESTLTHCKSQSTAKCTSVTHWLLIFVRWCDNALRLVIFLKVYGAVRCQNGWWGCPNVCAVVWRQKDWSRFLKFFHTTVRRQKGWSYCHIFKIFYAKVRRQKDESCFFQFFTRLSDVRKLVVLSQCPNIRGSKTSERLIMFFFQFFTRLSDVRKTMVVFSGNLRGIGSMDVRMRDRVVSKFPRYYGWDLNSRQ